MLSKSPDQRLLIFWDGATYHRSKEIRAFLDEINHGLPSERWKLQAKTWVRRFCALIPSFSHLKWMFEWFIRHSTFNFTTLQMYGVFSKIK